MKYKKIIAVDFDGTLTLSNKFPDIGEKNQQLFDKLSAYKKEGCYIILYTMRTGEFLQQAVKWCGENGLIFDAVNDNLPHMQEFFGNNPRKIFANVYIDDFGVSIKKFCESPVTPICEK